MFHVTPSVWSGDADQTVVGNTRYYDLCRDPSIAIMFNKYMRELSDLLLIPESRV